MVGKKALLSHVDAVALLVDRMAYCLPIRFMGPDLPAGGWWAFRPLWRSTILPIGLIWSLTLSSQNLTTIMLMGLLSHHIKADPLLRLKRM